MNSSGPAFKRCRPLLGTYVEVKLYSVENLGEMAAPLAWSDAAFATIERLQGLLSYHDETSDLNRLNDAPLGAWLPISTELRDVLALALRMQELSGGIFNAAVAEPLVRWGYLPGAASARQSWRYLAAPAYALRGSEARRVLPARIDLGGIAKGYAVEVLPS
jgi:thiamine biosynthesis lipoprotein